MRLILPFLLIQALAGCAIAPNHVPAPVLHDFGVQVERVQPVQPTRQIRAGVLVHNVVAPAWLDTTGIVYRLAYERASQWHVYAHSRWVASPAVLLGQRLRSRVAAVSSVGVIAPADAARADFALRVDLEEFGQVFDAADRSSAVVVARASLFDVARRTVHAQRAFTVTRPAVEPNADGAVRALTLAGDELVDAVIAWAAERLAPGGDRQALRPGAP